MVNLFSKLILINPRITRIRCCGWSWCQDGGERSSSCTEPTVPRVQSSWRPRDAGRCSGRPGGGTGEASPSLALSASPGHPLSRQTGTGGRSPSVRVLHGTGRGPGIAGAIKNQLRHPKSQRVIYCPSLVLYGIIDPFCELEPPICHKDTAKNLPVE